MLHYNSRPAQFEFRRELVMKFFVLPLFAFVMGTLIAVGIPSLARSSSPTSQTTTATPASIRPSKFVPALATSTTTENSERASSQSAAEARKDAEPATEKAYSRSVNDIENLALRGRVEAVLHQNRSTGGSDVHVTADNGTVTLWGRVGSERRAQAVQELVANVDGVRAVNNRLSFPSNREVVTPRDSKSTGVAHPAYSDLAPAERAPAH